MLAVVKSRFLQGMTEVFRDHNGHIALLIGDQLLGLRACEWLTVPRRLDVDATAGFQVVHQCRAGLAAIEIDDQHVDKRIAAVAERAGQRIGHDDDKHGRHQEQRRNAAGIFENDFEVFEGDGNDLSQHDGSPLQDVDSI